jgi:hypothetical protein
VIVRLFIVWAAAVISLFCLSFDSMKAEAADGGLVPLGISETSVPAVGTPQTSLGDTPTKASEAESGIPEMKADTPVEKPAVPEIAGETLSGVNNESAANVSDIASGAAGAADHTADDAVSKVTDIASKSTETLSDTADDGITDVTGTVTKSSESVGDSAGKVVTDVTNIVSRTTDAGNGDTSDDTGVNRGDRDAVPSKPPVTQPESSNLPIADNSRLVYPERQTKTDLLPTGVGISNNPKAESHAVKTKVVEGSKRQKQPLPDPLPKKHPDVPVLPPVTVLSGGERQGPGKSPRDNAGSDSYGKQSMVEGHMTHLSLPRYTGQLFHSRDRDITQWSQPPPEKPPQSTFFS